MIGEAKADSAGLIKKALQNFQGEALSSEHDQIWPKAGFGLPCNSTKAHRSIVRCSVTLKILALFMQP